MGHDGDAPPAGAEPYRPFRSGMEVEPAAFTAPEVRPGPQEWGRYRAPRFRRPVRVVWTIGILLLPVFLVWAALVQLLMAEGRARAGFAIFLFPMVLLTPLLVRAMRDLWGWER